MSNSSVLIALSSIGQLGLLHDRFSDGILVPEAVWEEVVTTGQGQPGAAEVAAASWITRQPARDRHLISALRSDLDAGEAEAIALARETGLSTVLLDEKDARRLASRIGLQVLGTVGILIWARQTKRIPRLRECLDTLCNRGRFRLHRTVINAALHQASEPPLA